MKNKIIALTIFCAALSNVAKAEVLWECQGADLEGLTIEQDQEGNYSGGVSWDCFPGGGICERTVGYGHMNVSRNGDNLIYIGEHFALVLLMGDARNSDGSVKGHISATGQGPADQGGGYTESEAVSCTQGSTN